MIARSWLDDPHAQPTLTVVPDSPDPPAVPFRLACRPEYQRRLLAIYVGCTGWTEAQTAPIKRLIEQTDDAFLAEDALGWLEGLAALERAVGSRRDG